MKFNKDVFTFILVASAIVVGAASVFFTKKPDNPIEQVAEAVIENELDLPRGSIDFTPLEKEIKK